MICRSRKRHFVSREIFIFEKLFANKTKNFFDKTKLLLKWLSLFEKEIQNTNVFFLNNVELTWIVKNKTFHQTIVEKTKEKNDVANDNFDDIFFDRLLNVNTFFARFDFYIKKNQHAYFLFDRFEYLRRR